MIRVDSVVVAAANGTVIHEQMNGVSLARLGGAGRPPGNGVEMAKVILTPNQEKILRLVRAGRRIDHYEGRIYMHGDGKHECLGFHDVYALERGGWLTSTGKLTKAAREGRI